MKYQFFCLILFLAIGLTATAQDYQWGMSSGKLVIQGINNVIVEGHSGGQVAIAVAAKDKGQHKPDERARGLTAVNAAGGSDNTGLGLSLETNGNDAVITPMNINDMRTFTVKVPSGVTVMYESSSPSSGKVSFIGTSGEIEANMIYGQVHLENIKGPAAINTIYGNIEGSFGALSQNAPIHLHSEYGHIDVTVPASAKADFRLKTTWGKAFTDLDLKYEYEKTDKGMKKLTGSNVTGKLNGGGAQFSAKTGYSNIYIRKS